MNQLEIVNERRKAIDLLLQSQGHERENPQVSYATPRKLSRSMSLKRFEGVEKEKLNVASDEENQNLSLHLIKRFSFGSKSSPPVLRYNISPMELIKASNSVLNQVDWSVVMLDAIGRENSAVYQDIFEKILKTQIKKLQKQIECKKGLHLEYSEEVSNDTKEATKINNDDIESSKIGSDDKAKVKLESFDKTSFVKSEEGGDYRGGLFDNDEVNKYESGLYNNDEEDEYGSGLYEKDEGDEYKSDWYKDNDGDEYESRFLEDYEEDEYNSALYMDDDYSDDEDIENGVFI